MIGIIGGKGKMGSLLRQIFQEYNQKVIFSDRKTVLTNTDVAKKADIIFLAVPIDQTIKIIHEIQPCLKNRQLLIDISSIKDQIIPAMRKTAASVISTHPMFNESSFAPGQRIIIMPVRAAKSRINWLKDFFRHARLNVIEMDWRKHDRLMALIQGLVHFSEISFINALKKSGFDIEECLEVSSAIAELKIILGARILSQDAKLYGDIEMKNPDFKKIINLYTAEILKLKNIVLKKNYPEFLKFFRKNSNFLKKNQHTLLTESDWILGQIAEKNRRLSNRSGLKIASQEVQKEKFNDQKADLVVLGPKYSFSDLAAGFFLKLLKKNNPVIHYSHTITQAFQMLAQKKAKFLLAPIENQLDGTIQETLDNLFHHNFQIFAEISVPIKQCLAIHPHSPKNNITALMSHPKALQQCQKYLQKNFPAAELIHFSSTSAAMQNLAEEKHHHIAVIGNITAAKAYKLKILKLNIADHKKNHTNFLLIGESSAYFPLKIKKTRTSIAFYFAKNQPGLLYGIYKEFADNNVNLTRIESRPSKKAYGDYIFYLDFEGAVNDQKIKKLLEKIRPKLTKLKIFGSYGLISSSSPFST